LFADPHQALERHFGHIIFVEKIGPMKPLFLAFILSFIALTGFAPVQSENVEFVCLKTHKASNTCYFNFKVDGGKYRYEDVGCKKSKKKEEVVKHAKEGKLALAKDWKIDCPEPKETTGL
jgi:hypothetical protein